MKQHEKEALMLYLDFHLMKITEKYERHLNDPVLIYSLYDDMYGVLNDIGNALDEVEYLKVDPGKKNVDK